MQLGQLRKAAWRMQSPYLYSPVRSMNTVTCNTSKCPDLCTVRWSSEMNAELHLPCAKKICLCYSINFETIFNSYARQMSHRPSSHSGEPRGQKGKIQMSRKASNFSQAFFNIELANWRNGKFWRWQFSYYLKNIIWDDEHATSECHSPRLWKILLNNWTVY